MTRLEHVVTTLLPLYGLAPAQLHLLQYENNAVYHLVTKAGKQFVVRVATPAGRSAEEQRSEMHWLQALRRDTSLVVPAPVHNLAGELVTTIRTGIVSEANTEAHPCVVLRWIAGAPPGPDLTLALIEQIGKCTAQMHQYASQFQLNTRIVRPRWDWERFFGAHSIVQDQALMAMLRPHDQALHAAAEQIGRALSCLTEPALSHGPIHADLHTDNILIRGSRAAIIDFDDCGSGHYLYDIASLLDSLNRRVFRDAAHCQEGREALLRGYSQIRPLPSDLEQSLGMFMAFRNMVTLDFILRSTNANVQEWGPARVIPLIDQLRHHLDGYTS